MSNNGAPIWALDLIDRVCADEGIIERPTLSFRTAKPNWIGRVRRQSSGRAYSRFIDAERRRSSGVDIYIQAGTSENDQKLVLLHEMAHWLLPHVKHGKGFWDKAFDLYRRYGITGEYALGREKDYRIEAMSAYNRSKYVTHDNAPVHYTYKRLNKRCDCGCHILKVKA